MNLRERNFLSRTNRIPASTPFSLPRSSNWNYDGHACYSKQQIQKKQEVWVASLEQTYSALLLRAPLKILRSSRGINGVQFDSPTGSDSIV